jgi:FkbM family methyltransferase
MNIISRVAKRLVTGGKKQSFGLNQLDLKLEPYISFRSGFFIEAGASDGISQSNTLYFEKYKNWTGILIEPIPELAIQCKENRPNCIVENCALVSFDYTETFVEMRYCRLMSTVKGALTTPEVEEDHIRRGCEMQGVSSYDLQVPARTLTSILNEYNVTTIDFFSLDVEGYEINVLKGIDFEKHRPNLMLVEALDPSFRDEIDRFLQQFYIPIAALSDRDVLYKYK